ncbi:MAG: ABC-2 transporter permease [Oscillospiraceae bacterium]|nr:ABC-2 transporter permease [Oscillospiraceae bacterium]
MKGLILKDLFNLRRYLKTYAMFFLIYGVLSFMQQDASFFSGALVVIISLLPISCMSLDEYAHWDIYAQCLPLSKKCIVGEKYVLAMLISIIAGGLSFVFQIVVSALMGLPIDFLTAFLVVCACILVSQFLNAIVVPTVIKYGADKARYVIMLVALVPTLFVLFLSKTNIPKPSEDVLQSLPYIGIIVAVAAIAISYFVSVKLYTQKEF